MIAHAPVFPGVPVSIAMQRRTAPVEAPLPTLPPAVAPGSVRKPEDRFRCEPYRCLLTAASCVKRQVLAGANHAAKGAGSGAIDSERHKTLQTGGSYAACVDCADGRAIAKQIQASKPS